MVSGDVQSLQTRASALVLYFGTSHVSDKIGKSCVGDVVATGDDAPYRDPRLPIEARISDLLSRMTLAEKIGQMTQIDRSVASFDVIRDLSIGSVLNGGDSAPSPDWTPSMWADMVDGYQRAALSSRLGIPMIYGTDAVHGHNNVFGSTAFPHNISLGATRDADLVLRIGKATALEIRGTGIPYAFAPCLAYLLYGPLVAKALHSWVYEDGQRYSWCLHILIICALRGLIYQLWHSYGSMLFLTRNRMVNKQGVGYKQIDEEWDCSNANPPFWIPIHIVNPERPTECAIFNVIADSPRDSVQFMEWSPAPCPRALLIANFHGRITIWTQPSQGPVNLVRDASCWHCEHEWRQDLAVVTKWLAGMYPRHFVYTVMALLTCFVSMHLVCCVCQEQFALCFNRSANPEVVKQFPSLAAAGVSSSWSTRMALWFNGANILERTCRLLPPVV
ncbi:Glycoside hydrolase [Cinnamomum micranthum f. kanehirae]|uniref:Glycoside hydrolase n=1 Tax=Cinnamomum micranthum f. kanehirae TaxID=337451 RepID=A0A443PTV8_9MAGN|nr:Glycoside hydrolase [Cinnamomum micranthum f. kanehirae]